MCSIPECDRTGTLSLGMCKMHYQRSKTGRPMTAGSLRKEKPRQGECSIDGCDSVAQSRGWCSIHYTRWRKHGDPLTLLPVGVAPKPSRPGESNSFWRGDDVTYIGMHARVRRAKGLASDQDCCLCQGPASEWAYNNGDPLEKVEEMRGSECAYSTDMDFYVPMCATCHRRFDRSVRSMI